MVRDILNSNDEARAADRTLALLRRDFPQCFNAEGKFDMAAFGELLSDSVDIVKEGSGFNFLGKNYASLLSAMDTTTVVVPDTEHNSREENAESGSPVYFLPRNFFLYKEMPTFVPRIKRRVFSLFKSNKKIVERW